MDSEASDVIKLKPEALANDRPNLTVFHVSDNDQPNKIIETEHDRKRAAIERRTLQNRIAQRLYRQRKDNRIAELEARVAAMLGNKDVESRGNESVRIQELQRRVMELEAENARLKEGRRIGTSRDVGIQLGHSLNSMDAGVGHQATPHQVLHAGYSHYAATGYPYPPPNPTFSRVGPYRPLSYPVAPYSQHPAQSSDSRFGMHGHLQTSHAYYVPFSAATNIVYPTDSTERGGGTVDRNQADPASEYRPEYIPTSNVHTALAAERVTMDRILMNPNSDQHPIAYSGSSDSENPSNEGLDRIEHDGGRLNDKDPSSESWEKIMIIKHDIGDDIVDGSSYAGNPGTSVNDVHAQNGSGVSNVNGQGGAFSIKALLLDDGVQTALS